MTVYATPRTCPQVGVFFPMILLKPFEPPNVPGVGAGAAPGGPMPTPAAHQHPPPCPPGLLLFRVSVWAWSPAEGRAHACVHTRTHSRKRPGHGPLLRGVHAVHMHACTRAHTAASVLGMPGPALPWQACPGHPRLLWPEPPPVRPG